MWWMVLAGILTSSLLVMYYKGPAAGLGTGVLLSFLFPSWLDEPILGAPMDLRIATTFVLLLAFVAHPKRRIDWSFSEADWAVFVLYFVHVASDTMQEGFRFSHLVRAFGEWSIPYIAGRLAIQSADDWKWLTKVAVVVASICATLAVVESVTRVNPENIVFYARPVDRTSSMQIRMGVKRAEGPTRHPIWFGMVQTLLLPWTLVAAHRALRGDGPDWWLGTPVWLLCGIVATMGRGPMIGACLIIYLSSFALMRRYWKPLLGVGIAVVIAGLIGRESMMSSIDSMEGRRSGLTEKDDTVEFEGERHEFSSMSHRWLIFSAYRHAIAETGLFGFGTANTSKYPVNVPLGPDAFQTVQMFWSIDCEYLLLLLRFGWAGMLVFAAVCVLSALHIFQQAQRFPPMDQFFPYTIAATVAATTLVLLVEWMPHDYGFMFLWMCGIANGPRLEEKEDDGEKERPRERSHRHHSSSHRSSSRRSRSKREPETYAEIAAKAADRAREQSDEPTESNEH